MVSFRSFTCDVSFPTPFIEETVFPPLCILAFFVTDQLTLSVRRCKFKP